VGAVQTPVSDDSDGHLGEILGERPEIVVDGAREVEATRSKSPRRSYDRTMVPSARTLTE